MLSKVKADAFNNQKETKVAKVVTFANVKGGSGKSTLCINMAAILIRSGYSVAILDADQQKCSQDWITGTKDKLLSRVEIIDQAEFIASENVDVDLQYGGYSIVDLLSKDTFSNVPQEAQRFVSLAPAALDGVHLVPTSFI